VRTSDHVDLNPTDQLPFSSGWINSARAAWRILKPVWPLAAAPFLLTHLVLALAQSLAQVLLEADLPRAGVWAYLGVVGTISFALATIVMFGQLVEGEASIQWSLALVSSRARVVVLAGLLYGALHTAGSMLDPRANIFLLFYLMGPPLLMHSLLLECSTVKEAFARSRQRLKTRVLDLAFAYFVVGAGVLLLRIWANRTAGSFVGAVLNSETFPGFLISDISWSLISGASLTYMVALSLVTYLNARSLSEGVDTRELSKHWLYVKWQGN
jgi:hypothetical protein